MGSTFKQCSFLHFFYFTNHCFSSGIKVDVSGNMLHRYIGVSVLCSLCAWLREGERRKVLILYTLFVSESTLSSVHSGSPPSSAQEESAPSTSSPNHPSLSPGAKSFYPRQGATSKYLIGWKKPGGTINSVDFGSSRK